MNKYLKPIGIYVLIFVVILAALAYTGPQILPQRNDAAQEEYVYSDLLKELDENNVASVEVSRRTEVGDYGTAEATLKDGSVIRVDVPSISVLQQVLDEKALTNGVKIDVGDLQRESMLSQVVPSLIMMIVMIIIFILLFNRMQGGGGKMNNFGKSKAKMSVDGESNVTFDNVAGCDEEKGELEELVEFLKAPKKFTELGARIPKGVLLVGPPGTGKTLLAKAVAGEAGVPFFSISGSDFVEMFVGVGASRVRDLFEQAKKNAPSIVFIDEIDAVGRRRGAGLGGGHDEREQTLNQLLVEMDGFGINESVIIIAATNRADILDPALLRPGRFDRQVYVGRPDVKGREAILRVHAKGKPMASEVDLKVVAQTTAGFTGADLANLLNEAALLTARDGKKKIDMEEIQKALIKIGVGTEKKTRVISEKEKYITAYHEGGHAILFEVLSELDPVHSISIIPTGMAGGYTMPLPGEDRMYMTKMMMEQEIISLLGGRAAEELVIKDITTGASNDIERATSMARDMVTKYGMSELLGPIQFGGDNDEVFIGRDWGHARNYGEGVAATIDQEVNRIVTDAYREAKRLLQENMEMLHATAKLLVEKEKVTGDEFRSLFDQKVRNEVLGIANEAEQPTETAENREEN
ncbi:ATP-dependent zinc metalloprotease FtsH [Anaerotignum faecicola]|uniref:ATP-dependent zinc metalloprotease FtsH n=1 Tax=Anaerotignum faecicola TaxID=2358141 RepID=A0A401LFN4_9FIRM|nr:ATP-dependent zinc metalloprotease FtsH [Anaerotignum faecicola]RHR15335.1 ATP-dependent metallopeptidase FtsH/Yme1/Tma family protein [Firmicutes bacterium AF19-2LB]RHT40725.1 ATP-dependent metallopeptidase FtsH/Yme1/Tma family protein [Firmicutes bacterium AM29-6AC]GCB30322.1 ATP-dependent zinc metalloprotease FtsH [Anaerotignum faecicola]HBD88417.1 cell division protein FtsH [Tyzzerella sp.]